MTDLEMTKLAAKAVGKERMSSCFVDRIYVKGNIAYGPVGELWTPITDPAQAFELMEKLRMSVEWDDDKATCFILSDDHESFIADSNDWNIDLKRAIVECAARYQLEKEGHV